MFTYRCTECQQTFPRDAVRYLCPDCGARYAVGQPLRGVLEAIFDYEQIEREFRTTSPDWDLFCPVERRYHPPFPVGNTPMIRVNRLGESLGYHNLWVKFDGMNPSGSLKDRASYLMVAEANRLGEEKIVCASTGNAASALAAVCAAAGKKAVIFVPKNAPKAKLVQMYLYGAEVILVDGTYDDAFAMSMEYTRKKGGLNRNTAYHPLTIEGKKTVAFEIYAQSGFCVPRAVVVPVGDGAILGGVYKGFRDLLDAGLIDKLPRLICVQAEKSDAIHHYFNTGNYRKAADPKTVADSISVSVPANAHMARRALEESNGFSVTVSDAEILKAQATLARLTGIFAEPAAAAPVAALPKLTECLLNSTAQVVLLVTGHGLKDIDAPLSAMKIG